MTLFYNPLRTAFLVRIPQHAARQLPPCRKLPPPSRIACPSHRSAGYSTNAVADLLSSSAVVRCAEKGLQMVHEASGAAWWASILMTVVAARSLITLPFAVLQRRMAERLRLLRPKMDELAQQLAGEVKAAQATRAWSDQRAAAVFRQELRQRRKEFFIRHNSHPAKIFLLPFVQIPLWVAMSFALRNLTAGRAENKAEQTAEELRTGGALWFRDLTRPDRTWAIPLLNGLLTFALAELHFAAIEQATVLVRAMKVFSRFTAILLVPVTAVVPVGVSFYWLLSVLFGFLQFFILSRGNVQRKLGMPVVPRAKTALEKWALTRRELFINSAGLVCDMNYSVRLLLGMVFRLRFAGDLAIPIADTGFILA
ncbi:putative Mitochondrial inner membrane protein COX18 [Hypsibius exemplaris]|uniref:Mitochondrial inner membrane protein COX18 n=1 Tax=Hypsibius exemplaris TaxID=2072580 RepID=A0A1W0WHV8_HYPEX|nr:putative Mitochondrial inner membrane protein COX18 [Hypsibius exemplaris]